MNTNIGNNILDRCLFIIDCAALRSKEIMYLVASVCLLVCPCMCVFVSAFLAEWLTLPVQGTFLYVSNEELYRDNPTDTFCSCVSLSVCQDLTKIKTRQKVTLIDGSTRMLLPFIDMGTVLFMELQCKSCTS